MKALLQASIARDLGPFAARRLTTFRHSTYCWPHRCAYAYLADLTGACDSRDEVS